MRAVFIAMLLALGVGFVGTAGAGGLPANGAAPLNALGEAVLVVPVAAKRTPHSRRVCIVGPVHRPGSQRVCAVFGHQ